MKSSTGHADVKLKVLLVHPNGNVVTRNPTNEKTVQIIRNLVNGCWAAVANAVFDHPEQEFQHELHHALKRKVNKEFQSYSRSETVLKASDPDELSAFSNKLVVAEAKVYCPFWSASIMGATGVKDDKNVADNVPINQLALATAIVARTRNPKMSAVAYRISSLLIHSGATYQDITRLNKLGVCMSPQSTTDMQKKMGTNFDVKVLMWKSSNEDNNNMLRLLKEIITRQKISLEDDSMDLEYKFNLREETLKSYKWFDAIVYKKVLNSLITTEDSATNVEALCYFVPEELFLITSNILTLTPFHVI